MGGGLAVVGNIVDAKAEVNLGFICVNDIHFCGSTGASRRDMAGLLELHARSPLSVVISDRIPLENADEAQRRLRAGGIDGRLLLCPG
jgi:D-arabinose 1-dehydrogenase-like Zn-dependent alcohol dehydrogenase